MTAEVEMKFAWIPPGSFQMGNNANDDDLRLLLAVDDDENSVHHVKISKGFYLGIHPVTQAQWRWVMGSDNRPSHFAGDDRPVEQVSWDDCKVFCGRMQELTGKPIRLPTEAEWEYACRAGTQTPFSMGETISTDQANYNGNFVYGDGKRGIYRAKTVPVGSFPPNPWGLYDMHGNVWQWCQDMFDEYPKNDVTDPLVNTGENRVIRGGSWIDNPRECRAAYRGGSKPTLRHSLVGFRLCIDVDH